MRCVSQCSRVAVTYGNVSTVAFGLPLHRQSHYQKWLILPGGLIPVKTTPCLPSLFPCDYICSGAFVKPKEDGAYWKKEFMLLFFLPKDRIHWNIYEWIEKHNKMFYKQESSCRFKNPLLLLLQVILEFKEGRLPNILRSLRVVYCIVSFNHHVTIVVRKGWKYHLRHLLTNSFRPNIVLSVYDVE